MLGKPGIYKTITCSNIKPDAFFPFTPLKPNQIRKVRTEIHFLNVKTFHAVFEILSIGV